MIESGEAMSFGEISSVFIESQIITNKGFAIRDEG